MMPVMGYSSRGAGAPVCIVPVAARCLHSFAPIRLPAFSLAPRLSTPFSLA